MAEKNNTDKEALKAAKDAEKAAKKAKAERIKQSKPKKEGTVFSRGSSAVKKFFKDFTGTCKKVVWPTGKQVIKNSLIVLVTIVVIGAAVALIDLGLTTAFDLGEKGVVALADYVGEDETAEDKADADSTASDALKDLLAGAVDEIDNANDEEPASEDAEAATVAE